MKQQGIEVITIGNADIGCLSESETRVFLETILARILELRRQQLLDRHWKRL